MEFTGFAMPLQYTGILQEHDAVRRGAGAFDVSHMGELLVRGPQALDFLPMPPSQRYRPVRA